MLFTTLLAPFEDVLQRSSVLYFVADLLLQSIPYSFLPWSANADQLLVDRLPVVMCPSASACLGESASANASRSGPVAILRQSGGEYLPRLDWEVGEIAKLYRQATVLDATPSQLRAQLAAADILHYAGHAFVDPGFSRRFHEQLSRGVAPARALWLAQNVLRRSGRPPLDWAFPVLITRDAHSI